MLEFVIGFVIRSYEAGYLWAYLLGGFLVGCFITYQLFRLKVFILEKIFPR